MEVVIVHVTSANWSYSRQGDEIHVFLKFSADQNIFALFINKGIVVQLITAVPMHVSRFFQF